MPKYANVTATLALFVALGGTATAAVTLPRDSVGSPQIRKDAVRSPEIRAEAVRSSEIQDKTIRLEDLADGARNSLQGAEGPAGPQGPSGVSEVRFAEEPVVEGRACSPFDLADCPNLDSVLVTRGTWLVQAKFTVLGAIGLGNKCALVADDTTTLDEASVLGVSGAGFDTENVSLADVHTVEAPTRIAVRCTELVGDVTVRDLKLTALAVDTVVPF
jgi:hypothetical protein